MKQGEREHQIDGVCMLNETEVKWLDYAWRIATCPDYHRRECIRLGAARSRRGLCKGNDLRWPGYVGADYRPGEGVLLVGAVHAPELPVAPSGLQRDKDLQRTAYALTKLLSGWTAQPRSISRDEQFLPAFQRAFVDAAVLWERWDEFAKILEALELSIQQVAYTNLAKCKAVGDGELLVKFCQSEFAPISDLVETLNPCAVFTCVLNGGTGGSWGVRWCENPNEGPTVYPFHGRRGTDQDGRKIDIWTRDVASKLQCKPL